MKKNFCFRLLPFLLILLCVWGEMACAGDEKNLYPQDIQRIKQRGRIIVAQYGGVQSGFFDFSSHDAPMAEPSYLVKGRRMMGVDIELALRIAETLGVQLEMDRSATDFDTVCEQVALGKADVGISKLSVTLKRAQYVRFTEPYALLRMCLLVDRLYEAKNHLKGGDVISHCRQARVRIGVYKRSALEYYLHQWFPKAEAVLYDNFTDQVQALLNGEIYFVMDDEVEVVHYLKTHPELTLRLETIVFPNPQDPIAMAVSPDSPNLLALLNLLIRYSDIPRRMKEMQSLR